MIIDFKPTIPEDINYIIRVEQASENKLYVGQWSEDQHLKALEDDDLLHLVVERVSDRTPVGYPIMARIKNPDKSIKFRRIVITHKGRGYGRDTLKGVKKLAFEKYQAHRF